ncbi:hypothetical protein VULLAG_LOCUS8444 [Vulpes lagopus]
MVVPLPGSAFGGRGGQFGKMLKGVLACF